LVAQIKIIFDKQKNSEEDNMNSLPKGGFIVVDGGDGCGKTTQIISIEKYLVSLGCDVLITASPTYEYYLGKRIRQILAGKLPHPGAEVLQRMMAKDKVIHLLGEIQPHLDKGGVVVCARYFYSGLAFGQADGASFDALWEMNKNLLRPDLTIYLDLDPVIALDRIKKRSEESGKPLDIFEKLDLLKKVRENFLELLESCPELVMVDGSGTEKEVFDRILPYVKKMLSN